MTSSLCMKLGIKTSMQNNELIMNRIYLSLHYATIIGEFRNLCHYLCPQELLNFYEFLAKNALSLTTATSVKLPESTNTG